VLPPRFFVNEGWTEGILAKKSDARQALINYINVVENQLDCTVKAIRSYPGGEFNSDLGLVSERRPQVRLCCAS
jgi:hypothetical protein